MLVTWGKRASFGWMCARPAILRELAHLVPGEFRSPGHNRSFRKRGRKERLVARRPVDGHRLEFAVSVDHALSKGVRHQLVLHAHRG